MKVRDLIKLVQSEGWVHVRTSASHRIFKHPAKPRIVTIAGKPGDDVPPGTLKGILKDAGLEGR